MSNAPIIKPVHNAGSQPRRYPIIKTANMAKPMEPPLIKTPLDNMPCNSSKTNPNAANIPTSQMVLTYVDVLFIDRAPFK